MKQMEQRSIASTKLLLLFLAALLSVQVYQAARQPIRSAEAYTYDRFVRPTIRQVLDQELLNRQVLYALLEKRSVGLFHVSPFSVRLPSLLFGLLYLWSLWRLARRLLGTGWLFFLAVALAGLVPLWWGCFSTAQGGSAALALQVCAAQLVQSVRPRNLNLAGACLGLSAAASLNFAIPAAVLALVFLATLVVQGRAAVWLDRILIPAVLPSFVFLVLPLSHAHAASEAQPDLTLPGPLLPALRAATGSNRARIGASPGIEPIVNFYRAQHRVNTWEHIDQSLASGSFDYYVLAGTGSSLVEQRHLLVLYRDAGFTIARRSYDAK
jgi:hypothetical protein